MTPDKVFEFFFQWELAYRMGDCMPIEEYKAMDPWDVAQLNADAFNAFMEADNPL